MLYINNLKEEKSILLLKNEAILAAVDEELIKVLDNIAKAILDSLNGIAYKDDSQIVSMVVSKKYSNRPRVEITLKEKV